MYVLLLVYISFHGFAHFLNPHLRNKGTAWGLNVQCAKTHSTLLLFVFFVFRVPHRSHSLYDSFHKSSSRKLEFTSLSS
jgi:uncharacterized membrane protein (UPF0136 family)